MEKRVKHLVVDSGAFIKASPVHDYAENIYTVRGAVKEIRDKKTLQRLQFLPYELRLKEPSLESYKYVVEYSKKTGDYANLSVVDLQILALTYQLVKENIGTDHLNKDPKCKASDKPAFSDIQICGFYIPKKDSENVPTDSTELSELLQNNLNDIKKENSNNVNEHKEAIASNNDKNIEVNINHSKSACIEENAENGRSDEDLDTEPDEENDIVTSNGDHVSEEEDDDDEDSWITPQNIDEVREKMGALKLDSTTKVACVTTDFCIQNVLMQMGINVVSVDGMLIKQTRVFILRCFACYKTTNDTTKKFCPNCGNMTLKKVAVTVNEDGTKNIHINFRRPIPIRGTKYSLPMPKGGKHAMNPILCEDQPIPHIRPCKKALQKINVMDEDYVVCSSPFTMNDVNSRAAKLGIRANKTYHIRRNPNETRRSTGNKKNKR